MDMFNRAVLLRAMTSARGYLSASLAATTPPMQLTALLGTRSIPLAAHYSILHVTRSRAAVEVTYTFAKGSVRNSMTLVRTHGTWRISAIQAQ
jgi:hypothetical protein